MPSPDLIFNAVVFTAIGLVLAAATVLLRRDLRRGMISTVGLLLAGLGGLWLLARFGAPLGDGTVMIVLREVALLIVTLGITRIALSFVLNAVLGNLALPRILGELVIVVVLAGYALYRMDALGVNLAGIITTSAVVTGVIAFSLKETLVNLWGGIGLQLDNTCRMGDWIRIEGVTGQVVGIRWRYLSLATNDGETVIIPNGHLITNRVMVLGRRGDERIAWRRLVEFSVAYAVPPSRVVAAVDAALARAEIRTVATEPAPMTVCLNFGDSGVHYGVYVWVKDLGLEPWTCSQVRLHISATLARHGMEIPFPHRVLIQGKATDTDETRGRELAARVATLNRIPMFVALTDSERRALASELTQTPYVEDDVIMRQGEAAESLYVLAKGRVAFYDDSAGGTGRRDLLAKLDAPDVFGEMGLLTGQPRGATAIAEGEVVCYRLDKEGFNAILKARPELVEPVSQVVIARQAANDAKLQALSAEARARQTSGHAVELVRRIKSFFSIS